MNLPLFYSQQLTKKSILSLVLLVWLQFPINILATEPCNNMQSISEIWSCPGGGQGFFSVISDGCHLLVRLETCSGTYDEAFYYLSRPGNHKPGYPKIDALFQFFQDESERIMLKKGRTDADIKEFLISSMNKVLKQKLWAIKCNLDNDNHCFET